MPSLDSPDDIKKSKEMTAETGRALSFEAGVKSPVVLLSTDFYEGFVHWVSVAGNRQRVVCGGGNEGKGRVPEQCAICRWVAARYERANALEAQGKEKEAEAVKHSASDTRGRYEWRIQAVKGIIAATGQKRKDGKRINVPVFDDDPVVGVLSLTKALKESLFSMEQKYEFLETMADLVHVPYALVVSKALGQFGRLSFELSSKPVEIPDDLSWEPLDMSAEYAVDEVALARVGKMLAGTSTGDGVDFDDDDVDDEEDELDMDAGFTDDAGEAEEDQDEEPEEPPARPARKTKASPARRAASSGSARR